MLNKIITAKKRLLNVGRVTMNLIIEAMKDYLMRLYNWFSSVIRKISLVGTELFDGPRKFSRDKESKVVLFI